MAFIATSLIGPGNLSDVVSTQAFAPGTIMTGVDSTVGFGEFIFLKGVASTVAGSVVIFDTFANTTKLAVASDRGPVAVAMSPSVAGSFGWYQISGTATVKETGGVAGGKPYVTATGGVPSVTVVAGDKIDGMVFKTADGSPAAGFAYAQLARPCLSGNG